MRRFAFLLGALLLALPVPSLWATPTRNQTLPVLPAPGPVKVDGQWNDWDLSGGIFICGNVEQRLNTYSLWLHAMYDDKGLYLLARWTDVTPLNNATVDDQAWQGDCLQVRLGLNPPTRTAGAASGGVTFNRGAMIRMGRVRGGLSLVSVMGWRAGGVDQVQVGYGQQFTPIARELVRQALARQACALYSDHKGYSQELFVPWSLISDSGKPAAGSDIPVLVQPNFSDDKNQRIADVDVIADEAGNDPEADRQQYFLQPQNWGRATFLAAGKITPPAVPLSNGKSYSVALVDGLPVVDWQGWVKQDPPVSKLELAPGLAPARQAEIAAAITQLGADSAADRKAARAKVKAFGPDAQPALEEHFTDPDPELSAVARELWNEIDAARPKPAAKPAEAAPGNANNGVQQIQIKGDVQIQVMPLNAPVMIERD